jgi:hypothetical protein
MIARLAVLGVLASGRLAPGQGDAWEITPARPTVGDTIWLQRSISVPGGWQVRAGKLEPTAEIEPLGDPAVLRSPDGWVVRYPVVAWAPGTHRVALPPVWRLGPDGRADSLAGGAARIDVTSVLPDTTPAPQPKALLGPLRSDSRDPLPPLLAALVATGLLAGGVAWRRRGPRPGPAPPHVPLEPEVPDARWLAAGEPKAVAARATWRVRAAVARAVPEAHLALSTAECLTTLARVRPQAPLRELGDLLAQLDRVAFASAPGSDVAVLATMARRMAREFEGGGRSR